MPDNQRTLTANFTADTSGFSPKVNELIQKLKVLNQDFEQNKSKVKELSAQLKTYESELKKLNLATNNGANASEQQKSRMQQLRDSIASCNVQIGAYKAAQGQLRTQINSTNRELAEQQTAFAETADSANDFNSLIQKLEELNRGFKHNSSEIKSISAQLKEYREELQKLNSETSDGAHASTEQKQRMQQLREGINACTIQIRTYEGEQTKLRAEINSTSRDLNKQNNVFDETENVLDDVGGKLAETADTLGETSTALQDAGQAANAFGDVLKANLAADFIKNSLRELIDLLRQAAAFCYQVGADFEAGMSQVAAVSGASGSDLEQLTAKAKQLGAETKFTAAEAAEALNYMAMAGWKTEEMLAGIDGVLDLAAASGADLGTTSDIVTDALTAFGMKAEDCSHFADILAAASSNANTNVTMMGETFKYCAPIAGSLGFTAEDTAVAIGLMANSGIKASQAGTALRTIMTKLSSDVKIAGESIGEVVVKTTNADGSMRDLSDIVTDLREAFSGLSESEQTAAAKSIVGAEAMSGFLAIMNAGEADVQKLTGAIENCAGAAADMSKTMQNNLRGAMDEFSSALEGVGIAVYDKFKGALVDTVNIFTECLSDMTSEIDNGGALGESIESLAESFKSAAKEGAVIAKDNLPGLINWLSKAIKFVVDFRNEIAAALKGILAYKGINVIGGIIQSVITKFTALKAAAAASEGAVKGLGTALNGTPWGLAAAGIGIVVGVISDIVSHAKTAAERIDELREQSDKAAQSAEEYAQKSENLRDVQKRYDEIYNSEKSSYDKGLELKDLQKQLISQYPDLAGKIDLVTGAYKDQAEAIRECISESEGYALEQAQIARDDNNALEDIERGRTFQAAAVEFGSFNDDKVRKIIEDIAKNNENITTEALQGAAGGFSLSIKGDSSEKQAAIDEIIKAFQRNGFNELYKADFKKLVNYATPYAEQAKKTKQALDRYEKLSEKEDPTDDNVDKMREDNLKSEEDNLKSEEDNLKSEEDNLKSEKDALDEMQSAYKKTLAAIDAEYERHKRAKSDSEFQSKINDIDKELQYGRVDEFERYELEKQRKKLIDEHNEELYSRNISDLKSSITSAYNAKQALANADDGTKKYTLALEDYTEALAGLNSTIKGLNGSFGINGSSVSNIDESTKNNYINVILQAVSKSNGQIIDELMKALQSGI